MCRESNSLRRRAGGEPGVRGAIAFLTNTTDVDHSYLALYSSGAEALMLGGVATIVGYTLFGYVNTRLIRLEALNNSVPTQTVAAQHIVGEPVPVNNLTIANLEIRP